MLGYCASSGYTDSVVLGCEGFCPFCVIKEMSKKRKMDGKLEAIYEKLDGDNKKIADTDMNSYDGMEVTDVFLVHGTDCQTYGIGLDL